MRLLTEPELAELAPGCDAGALPAIGSLFGVPMHVDFAVAEDDEISFQRRHPPTQRPRRACRVGTGGQRPLRRPGGRFRRRTGLGAIMIGQAVDRGSATATAVTLVWIDAREAILVRRVDGASRYDRVESEVPAHHRATGHV